MRAPSLVDLCIQSAIDNIQYIGDVGETDLDLLKVILPHCSSDQLMYIEESSEGRDLSPITDSLWHKFYERSFGEDNVNVVMKRMKQKRVSFKWRLLYQAKLKERQEIQQKSLDRLKQLYAKAGLEKQNKQIQLCSTIPPVGRKRKFTYGGSGPSNSSSNVKGRLMKKAKMEYVSRTVCAVSLYGFNLRQVIVKARLHIIFFLHLQTKGKASHEAQIHATMKKNSLQAKHLVPLGRAPNVSTPMGRSSLSVKSSFPTNSIPTSGRGSNLSMKGSALPKR